MTEEKFIKKLNKIHARFHTIVEYWNKHALEAIAFDEGGKEASKFAERMNRIAQDFSDLVYIIEDEGIDK